MDHEKWGQSPFPNKRRRDLDTHAETRGAPGCWHMPFMDKPDEVAQRVLGFLHGP
jgi:hypothetical protein